MAKVAIEVLCIVSGTFIYTSIVYWVLGFEYNAIKFIRFSNAPFIKQSL